MGPRLNSRGIPSTRMPAPRRTSCFNGAAAEQPRNPASRNPAPVRYLAASMGPRLNSRGITEMPRPLATAFTLQWGRG